MRHYGNDPEGAWPDEPRHTLSHCGSSRDEFLPESGWEFEDLEDEEGRYIVWYVTCPRCGLMVTENQ